MIHAPAAVARIAVAAATYAIDKPYSYAIPAGMTLAPGQRVQVSFGRGRRRSEGIVLTVESADTENLKLVEQTLEDTPALSPYQLKLAAFLRERYFCTFFDAARVMLPAGLWFRSKNTYALTEDTAWQEKPPRKSGALPVLQAIRDSGGSLDDKGLEKQFTAEMLDDVLPYLLKKKWLSSRQAYSRRGNDKQETVAALAIGVEQIRALLERPNTSALQRSVLELLSNVGMAAVKDICYYTGASAAVVKRLEKNGVLTLSQREVLRCREIVPAKLTGPLVLNEGQSQCFSGLKAQLEAPNPGTALLYGVTGSGKTSVYIKLIGEALAAGKSAILLVPEIALTPQLLGLMAAYFGDQVGVLHSSLSAGERYDQYKRIASGKARVVVGTRSAVFAPAQNLGLMILDEEQEHSYQSEASPRYCAREVARWRGVQEKALVLFGSATPSVESMYHAKQGDYTLYTLPGRYNQKALPQVEIVDLREEIKMGNDLSLSVPLRQAMLAAHEAGEQTVLLLNRRGNSRALVCVDCRQGPKCPRCDQSMTYHSANDRLMCHYCGYSVPAPRRCPSCGGPLKAVGVGTQKVEQELAAVFPDFTAARMDADTVSALNTHEAILNRFQSQSQDVLLGTQMVAKGLNLPKVSLVGVLDGDLGLYTGGYRAAETTFDMLTQVVGRAGRGETEGRAVIQTLNPEHQVIQLAAQQDYMGFYDLEIQVRKALNAPPFSQYVSVKFTGQEEPLVLRAAAKFRDSLLLCLRDGAYKGEKCQVLGPAPCPVPKINYHYRYQLTLTCQLTKGMRELLSYLLRQAGKDSQTRGVSAYIEVNAAD